MFALVLCARYSTEALLFSFAHVCGRSGEKINKIKSELQDKIEVKEDNNNNDDNNNNNNNNNDDDNNN